MKLSIIIVNYNVKYFLEQCLHSCEKAMNQMRAVNKDWLSEIIVVDNNSVDGSVEMLEERFPQVRRIVNKVNKGFSKANNQAINIAKGEYMLLLNPDTVVEEDTFISTVSFMESHAEAGALGVKMLDGKGRFLPESKRALPAPDVAFYKMFGLSRLFPRSKTFGKYHLGYLDSEQINSVDILSGAFMLIRKKVLDEIGLLDETFFMYGEDIDLSHRIIQAGYKNYYYPLTRIIHYKGESTKKNSVNYVIVFYKAMIIFAQKHFTSKNAKVFTMLINLAIYFRAGITVVTRLIISLSHPFIDWTLNLGLLIGSAHLYERHIKFPDGISTYPERFFTTILPIYSLLWVTGILATGAYTWIYQTRRLYRGIFIGTLLVILLYAFLDEDFRYSRAMIVIGGLVSFLSFYSTRFVWHLLAEKSLLMGSEKRKRMIVVGSQVESQRVESLLDKSGITYQLIGRVNPEETDEKGFLGSLRQLREIVDIHKVNEVIFCSKDLRSSDIFNWMLTIQKPDVFYKIVPEESLFIIGSNSKDQQGDYYTVDIKLALKSPENQFNKRILDILVSIALLGSLPLSVLFVNNKGNFIRNIFAVLAGKLTWVGYSDELQNPILPTIKSGVIKPSDRYQNLELEVKAIQRIDMAYARNYGITKDLELIYKAFSRLGN